MESEPTLVRESQDLSRCIYEFEWHTAAACVLSKKTGTDCKVFDDDQGITIDQYIGIPFYFSLIPGVLSQ